MQRIINVNFCGKVFKVIEGTINIAKPLDELDIPEWIKYAEDNPIDDIDEISCCWHPFLQDYYINRIFAVGAPVENLVDLPSIDTILWSYCE